MAAEFVVVLFSYDKCELNEATRCPMEVIGPLTGVDAEAVMARAPKDFLPHKFRLRRPK